MTSEFPKIAIGSSPEEIADFVLRLLHNGKLGVKLCANGKKAILRKFRSENVSNRSKEAMDSLIAHLTH